jgi:hypothetical protein
LDSAEALVLARKTNGTSSMTFGKKLLILWGVVITSYALLAVLTNPVIMTPRAQQEAIFQAHAAELEKEQCWPPPEDIIAARFNMTYRSVRVILRHGHQVGWWVDPCDPYR